MKYGSITQSIVHYILNTTFSTISGASLFPLDAYYSKCFPVLCLILACFIWLDHFTKWQHQCLGVILQVSVSNSCFTEIPRCTRLPKCAFAIDQSGTRYFVTLWFCYSWVTRTTVTLNFSRKVVFLRLKNKRIFLATITFYSECFLCYVTD